MCLELCSQGIAQVDRLLWGLGQISIHKALNPLDDADFLTISARLALALKENVAGDEAESLRIALAGLDVNWTDLAESQRDRVVEAAAQAIGSDVAPKILPKVDEVFSLKGTEIAKQTRRASKTKFGLKINAGLTTEDRGAIEFLRQSNGLFIKEAYGARSASMTATASRLVASGLEAGRSSLDISETLQGAFKAQAARSESYWDVVSFAFSNNARNGSALFSFADAGIEAYQFLAVLDEVTTEPCRLLDGRTFSVNGAVGRMQATAELDDPEDIKASRPWIRRGRSEDGDEFLYIERRGERTLVAEIERSADGKKDQVGSYRNAMTDKQLEESGISWPPLHGKCRSQVAPA